MDTMSPIMKFGLPDYFQYLYGADVAKLHQEYSRVAETAPETSSSWLQQATSELVATVVDVSGMDEQSVSNGVDRTWRVLDKIGGKEQYIHWMADALTVAAHSVAEDSAQWQLILEHNRQARAEVLADSSPNVLFGGTDS